MHPSRWSFALAPFLRGAATGGAGSRRLALAAIAAAAIVLPTLVAAQAPPPIKVGILSGFTGPGAQQAAAFLAGARLAVDEVNKSGGMLGRKLELIQADDALNPTQSVFEARRLVKEGVVYVMGPMASHLAVAVAPVLAEAKIPQIGSTVATGGTPYSYSSMFSGDLMAEAMLKFAAQTLKAKNIAIMTDTGNIGVTLLKNVRTMAPSLGLNVVAVQQQDLNAADLTPQILSLRRANPDVVIHSTSLPSDAGRFLKNLEEVGWNPKVVSSVFASGTDGVMKVAGANAFRGGHYYGLMQKAHTYCATDKVGERPYEHYMARLKAADPALYAKIDTRLTLYYYDAVMLLKAAAEATKSVSGPTLVAWLQKNASQTRGAAGYPIAITADYPFMVGVSALTFVTRPDVVRPEDSLTERNVDCS